MSTSKIIEALQESSNMSLLRVEEKETVQESNNFKSRLEKLDKMANESKVTEGEEREESKCKDTLDILGNVFGKKISKSESKDSDYEDFQKISKDKVGFNFEGVYRNLYVVEADRWVTIKGTHVLVDDKGNIKDEKLKKEIEASDDSSDGDEDDGNEKIVIKKTPGVHFKKYNSDVKKVFSLADKFKADSKSITDLDNAMETIENESGKAINFKERESFSKCTSLRSRVLYRDNSEFWDTVDSVKNIDIDKGTENWIKNSEKNLGRKLSSKEKKLIKDTITLGKDLLKQRETLRSDIDTFKQTGKDIKEYGKGKSIDELTDEDIKNVKKLSKKFANTHTDFLNSWSKLDDMRLKFCNGISDMISWLE